MASTVLKPEEMATPAPGARKRAALNSNGQQHDFPSAQEYETDESESEADDYSEDERSEEDESVENTEDDELDKIADEEFDDDDIEDEFYLNQQPEDGGEES